MKKLFCVIILMAVQACASMGTALEKFEALENRAWTEFCAMSPQQRATIRSREGRRFKTVCQDETPSELDATIIDSDGNERMIWYGLKVPYSLFPSALVAWVDDNTVLDVRNMDTSTEPVTTDPERIEVQLGRWIQAINQRLESMYGTSTQTEPEKALRRTIQDRVSVVDNRFKLANQ